LATTTSTQDSGLLDVLIPAFEQESGIDVKVVAVGSGQALELGRRGDADVLLTHSPDAERKFIEEGWGRRREPVMHNDFVIVGPKEDKAGVRQAKTAAEGLERVSVNGHPFVSRDDDSGTHRKEQEIWKAAGISPEGTWYIRAGTGMAQALRMANEKGAYVLTDRATYLATKQELDLVVTLEGDALLVNQYSVIVVSAEKLPRVHEAEAGKFAEFLLSPKGQHSIGVLGVDRYGQALFVPDAVLTDR
jgi:tungstate transport system substrate-binding protein